MGKRYEQHSDLCGCERCAAQADRENPSPVFDVIEDDDVLDCGCPAWAGCDCWEGDFDPDPDELAERLNTTTQPTESQFQQGDGK